MEDEMKKTMEDINVIKSVMLRTKVDLIDISMYFIWTGICIFLSKVLKIFTDYIYIKYFFITEYTFTYGIYRVMEEIIISIFLFLILNHYYKIVKKKNNEISKAIIYFWGIITILIPICCQLVDYNITRLFSTMPVILDNTNTVDFLESIFLHTHFTRLNYEFIPCILGIFLIGILAAKRSVVVLATFITLGYFVIEIIILESYRSSGIMSILFLSIYVIVEGVGILLLGILLILEGRKTMNGIE